MLLASCRRERSWVELVPSEADQHTAVPPKCDLRGDFLELGRQREAGMAWPWTGWHLAREGRDQNLVMADPQHQTVGHLGCHRASWYSQNRPDNDISMWLPPGKHSCRSDGEQTRCLLALKGGGLSGGDWLGLCWLGPGPRFFLLVYWPGVAPGLHRVMPCPKNRRELRGVATCLFVTPFPEDIYLRDVDSWPDSCVYCGLRTQ